MNEDYGYDRDVDDIIHRMKDIDLNFEVGMENIIGERRGDEDIQKRNRADKEVRGLRPQSLP